MATLNIGMKINGGARTSQNLGFSGFGDADGVTLLTTGANEMAIVHLGIAFNALGGGSNRSEYLFHLNSVNSPLWRVIRDVDGSDQVYIESDDNEQKIAQAGFSLIIPSPYQYVVTRKNMIIMPPSSSLLVTWTDQNGNALAKAFATYTKIINTQ